jgi:hypothetical protein
MSGLICAGNGYLDLLVSGAQTGERGPYNLTKVAVSPGKATTLERSSYMRDTYGQVLDSVVIPGSATLDIETDDASAEALQYMLLGAMSALSTAAGTVSSGSPESVTGHLNYWVKLANRNVSNVVVKDSANAITYSASTDYVLDAVAGMIKPLAGGTITDGATLHVSYSYGALSGSQIIAATQTEVRCQFRLDGKNLANQKKVELLCYQAVLTPSGTLDFAGKKFATFALSGSLVTPDGKSGPFYYREIN